MYAYNQYDKQIVAERVEQFRDQTRRFLAGELEDEEFRPLRLMNGLYIQRQAPMLRVAIPYGTLNGAQLRMLGHIARKYDKGYGHISTRQNIQYNWPKLETVPDILADLATVEMHAIQTSGNCIRNITTDQLAGANAQELEDPRPLCEIMRQWSTFHPEFQYLPRKFKIAVSGSPLADSDTDRAAVQLHDIGLYYEKNADGVVGFRVMVGGGQGRMPYLAKTIYEWVAKEDILSCLEAIVRIYNQKGRRDNMHRARIKILVNALGIDTFRELVDAEWAHIKDSALKITDEEITRVSAFFNDPAYRTDVDIAAFEQQQQDNPAFARWIERNTTEHKTDGYRSAYISLKMHGLPPGDVTDVQLENIADLAEQYSFDEARTTHDQNMLLPHVAVDQLYALWEALRSMQLAMPVINTLVDMICCPGLDFCSLANAESLSIAKQIEDKFDDVDYLYDIGELKIKMSGCMNACGHHHVGHIGILGVDKKGESWYQLTLGGSAANDAALGDRLGRAIAKEDVADTIGKLLDVYVENRHEDERFIDTYRRIGIDSFKDRVYPAAA